MTVRNQNIFAEPKLIQFVSQINHQCCSVRITDPIHYTRDKLYPEYICVWGDNRINPEATVVVFQRPCSQDMADLIKLVYQSPARKGKILLEYDDALWNYESLIISDSTKSYNRQVAGMNKALMRDYCDGVVVSTEFLAEEAAKVTNKPIVVFKNAIPYHKSTLDRTKTILYTGADLKTHVVGKAWIEALKEMKERGYKVLSANPIEDISEPFKKVPYQEFKQNIWDIAPEFYIAPLADSYLNRGRSDLKELEAWCIGAKFVGQGTPYSNGLPWDASKEDILKAFETATIPAFDETRDLHSERYARMFLTVYSGYWLGH